MNEAHIGHWIAQTLVLSVQLSLPAILAATFSGLLIGLLQALTQIQEQTLSYAVKLAAVTLALLFSGRWMFGQLHGFTVLLLDRIATLP